MAEIKLGDFEKLDFGEIARQLEELERENPKNDILSVLKQGLPMASYKMALDENMHQLEGAVVESYLHNSDYLLDLYHEATKCDTILAEMEGVLSKFSTNLSGVSDEIRSLQFRSEQLSKQLQVQANSQSKLTDYLKAVIVSPDMISIVFDEEDCGSDKFMESISVLSRQIQMHSALSQTLPAVVESGPELIRLKNKANLKIREYLVTRINSMKKSGANVQTIQKTVLVKARKLMRFLKSNEVGLFSEIVNHYSSTVSKIYSNQFRQYIHSLSKLALEQVATKSDLLGSNLGDPAVTGTFTSDILKLRLGGSAAPAVSSQTQPSDLIHLFSISIRETVLKNLETEVIVAEADNRHYPESFLRSYMKLLCDTVTSEYLFLLDFFDLHRPQSPSSDQDRIEKYFENIFSKINNFLSETVINTLVRENYDTIGLVLAIRILEYFQDLMINRRKIAVLDGFFENILSQMRTRIRFLIDLNVDSLKRVDARKLSPESIDVIVKRFSEYCAAIVSVMNFDDDSSNPLMLVFENFLKVASSSGVKKTTNTTSSDVLPIKSYSTIVARNGTSSQVWTDRLNACISGYVEKLLSDSFASLIKQVMEGEKAAANSTTASSSLFLEYERSSVSFANNWKSSIEKIREEIKKHFSYDLQNEIFKVATTQLLLYYTRFVKVVEARTKDLTPQPNWIRQMVPTTIVVTEIKQQISK